MRFCHRRKNPTIALAIVAVLSLCFASPSRAEAQPTSVAVGELLPLRPDPDGGYTMNLAIDDAADGTYSYTPLTLGYVLAIGGMDVSGQGLFVHSWSRPGAAMQTVGLYDDVPRPDGSVVRIRTPLLLLENVPPTMDVAAIFANEIMTQQTLAVPALEILLNLAMPARWSPSETTSPTNGRSTMYAWTARKTTPVGEEWVGLYALQSDFTVHSTGPASTISEWTHRVEYGTAARSGSDTGTVAAAFVQERLRRSATTLGTSTRSTFAAGLTSPAGDVPFAQASFTETRAGEHYLTGAESYSGGFALGIGGGAFFVPLLGVQTTQTIAYHDDTTNQGTTVAAAETRRRTNLGVFAGSEAKFVPLVGYDYYGRRAPQDEWLLHHVANGGPGDQTSGSWVASLGTYTPPPASAWTPLTGFAYDDDFAGHHFEHRGRYSVGAFFQGIYQPVIATTYDGETPLFDWIMRFADPGAPPAPYEKWEVAAGAIVAGSYVPVAGVQFGPGAPTEAPRAYPWHLYLGSYLGRYDAFFPLLWASYNGDEPTSAWAVMLADRAVVDGAASEGDASITVGVTAGGLQYTPLASVDSSGSNPDATVGDQNQFYLVAGAYAPNGSSPSSGYGFVPLVGVTANVAPAADSTGTHFTIGTPVELEVAALSPSYTPLACVSLYGSEPVLVACSVPVVP